MRAAHSIPVILLVALAAASLYGRQTVGAQEQAELPDGVQQWMERDQVRRWAGLLEGGEKLFNEGSCARCHGEAGSGGRFGPDLTDATWVQSEGDLGGIRETIFWGVRRRDFSDSSLRFEMNPGGGMDPEWEDYDALAAYVWSLSNGTFLPER